MTTPAPPIEGTAPPLSLWQRFIGVVFSPRATFASIAAWPTWFWMIVLLTVMVMGSQLAFTSTDVGQQAALDQQIEWAERLGATITPEAEAQMRARIESPVSRGLSFAFGFIVGLLVTLAVAGVLFGAFAIAGGTASFKQVLAVVAHAGVITALGQVFALPLWFARGSMSGVSNLGVFAPTLEETFLGRLLGTIDLFYVWWLFVLAIGLGVLYRKRTQPVFLALLAVYVLVAVVIASVLSAFGGS